MNALVTLTNHTIDCNKKEIEYMKIKRDSIISELSDIHQKIHNGEMANVELERELSQYTIGQGTKSMNKNTVDECNLSPHKMQYDVENDPRGRNY